MFVRLNLRGAVMTASILLAMSGSARAEGSAPDAAQLCATDADRALVAAELKKGRGISFGRLSEQTGISPARLAQGLPEALRTGVSPTQFQAVWDSMRRWHDPSFTVEKDGSYFLTRGPLPAGAASVMGSAYFNMDLNTYHITGHLRPDHFGAVYAIKVPSSEGEFGMVAVYNKAGQEIFSVMAYPDGTAPVGKIPVVKPEEVAAIKKKMADPDPSAHEHPAPPGGWYPKEFLNTMAAMKAMPQLCEPRD